MKIIAALLLVSCFAFRQDKASESAVEAAACGPRDVEFEVNIDKLVHPTPAPETGKAVIYVVRNASPSNRMTEEERQRVDIVQSHEGAKDPATPSTFPDNDTNPQSYYANAHPYLDEPLERLRELIPELKGLQPSLDQKGLPMILQQAGHAVDIFFRDTPNLIADEYVLQQEIRSIGTVYLAQEIRDEYLILLHGDRNEAQFDEYRMDKKGNRINELSTGRTFSSRFFVTHGFALSCVYFSTSLQSGSAFRYLGEQRISSQNTYVVAFAQRPGDATVTETVRRPRRSAVQMLLQGIAWVDKDNFQIIKIQTDLLAPRPEVGLDRQTTEVTLSEVRLRGIASPLWLPKVVTVDLRFYGLNFRNEHHYANYRRYRVSSKMIFPH